MADHTPVPAPEAAEQRPGRQRILAALIWLANRQTPVGQNETANKEAS